MKKILYLFLLFLPVLGFTQSRYGVEGVPMCWTTALGVDSSIIRYVLVSTTGQPVKTIVHENASGVVVNVSGGTLRYGFCDCAGGLDSLPNGSVTWAKLANPVKDSIRFAKRDTFITVPPNTNYFQNTIDNPARFYNNIYFSCKGRTDTSIVAFLGTPVWEEQKGVTYNIKNDSGFVAAFVISNEHLSNSKRLYVLQRGQVAQVRLLPDAANPGQYGWAVNVVWDSIGGGGSNGIYGGSDSLSQENTYAAMAADGSQTFGLGHFPSFPDLNYNEREKGLYIGPGYWNEISLLYNSPGRNNAIGHTSSISFMYNQSGNRFGGFGAFLGGAKIEGRGSTITNKYWQVLIDSVKFEITRNIAGVNRTYNLLPNNQYPSTTSGVTNILKWTGNGSTAVSSFGYRYETDSIYSDVQVKMNTDATQSFGIGYLPNFSGGYANYGEYGIVISPDNYGEISMFDFKGSTGRRGSKIYTGDGINGMISFTQSKPKEAAGVLVTRGGLRLYSATSNAVIGYWGVTIDTSKFEITRNYSGVSETYELLPASAGPSTTSGAISTLTHRAGTPSFLRSQHKTISGTTDSSGDITITFDAAMPDATYTVIVTGQGATPYVYMTQSATLATSSVKVRMFTLAGAAAISTAYQISYEVKDTN